MLVIVKGNWSGLTAPNEALIHWPQVGRSKMDICSYRWTYKSQLTCLWKSSNFDIWEFSRKSLEAMEQHGGLAKLNNDENFLGVWFGILLVSGWLGQIRDERFHERGFPRSVVWGHDNPLQLALFDSELLRGEEEHLCWFGGHFVSLTDCVVRHFRWGNNLTTTTHLIANSSDQIVVCWGRALGRWSGLILWKVKKESVTDSSIFQHPVFFV